MGNGANGRKRRFSKSFIQIAITITTRKTTTGLVTIGYTRHDEPLRVNKRAIESDIADLFESSISYRWMADTRAVAVGLCDYESLRQHHEPQTIRDSDSYMDPPRSVLNHKVIKLGKLVDEHCNVFHIETAINNKMFPEGYDILTRNEDEFSFGDRFKWEAMKRTFSKCRVWRVENCSTRFPRNTN